MGQPRRWIALIGVVGVLGLGLLEANQAGQRGSRVVANEQRCLRLLDQEHVPLGDLIRGLFLRIHPPGKEPGVPITHGDIEWIGSLGATIFYRIVSGGVVLLEIPGETPEAGTSLQISFTGQQRTDFFDGNPSITFIAATGEDNTWQLSAVGKLSSTGENIPFTTNGFFEFLPCPDETLVSTRQWALEQSASAPLAPVRLAGQALGHLLPR